MTRTFDRYDTFGSALADPAAKAVLERRVPDLLQSSMASILADFPLGPFLEFAIAPDLERAADTLAELATVPNPAPEHPVEPPIEPRDDYEGADVTRASAQVTLPVEASQHRPVEISFAGPDHGNPFVDVDLTATATSGGSTLRAGGFYDGDGTYRLRFLPPTPGTWEVATTSNARSLDGIEATIEVQPSDATGPVRVAGTHDFAHADGMPYVPFGTTAYAWTSQPAELQDQTVASLAQSPFNKIRMCLFPKDFMYNANEPDAFVFPRREDGTFDTTRFDLDYFANLEHRLSQLDELGVQADLILFHPYDRWGFKDLGRTVDHRYLTYVVRRLAAFPHVWWSLANEYELLTDKRPEEWHLFAELIQREDHAQHLLSIHNWSELYDYSAPWATHCSIQRGDHDMGKSIDSWRHQWGKPVVIDEAGYEGDIDQGWGNLTAQALVDKTWRAAVRGGSVTHGETFHAEDEVLWWSKGGELKGDSPTRIGFLKQVVADSPTGRLAPLPSDWDVPFGGVAGEYVVMYFGDARPAFRTVNVPEGVRAHIDVIDAWDMTVDTLEGVHEGSVKVDLPAKPYIAVRVRAIAD